VRYVSEAEFDRPAEMLERIVDDVRAAGGKPYVIPESGANEVGALGYLECAVELMDQIAAGAPAFDSVVITAFSGGSQAGLLMGKQLAGLPGEVVGVPIAHPADRVRAHIRATIEAAVRRFRFALDVPKEIRLIDGCQGAGRARVGDEELQAIVALARGEGIVLDPTYTAKAFVGLLGALRRDPKALGRRVCFIHTGGIFSLFPLREPLSRLLDASVPS
jgi:1-aminocyclopropane-1-carboxylate deaminase/D-cysteine desulfhydrase-like pyridoxal-dependent ACC family enzyme